jgi:hypothetical protein
MQTGPHVVRDYVRESSSPRKRETNITMTHRFPSIFLTCTRIINTETANA